MTVSWHNCWKEDHLLFLLPDIIYMEDKLTGEYAFVWLAWYVGLSWRKP